MEKFKFYCPTEIIFGKDSELSTASLIKKYNGHNVLIVYGGGSVKRSGLLDKICQQLSNDNLSYMTLGGVQPNPVVSFVNDAVKKAYQANIDFVLAIGGGSVIDTAKAIAHGLKYPQNDIWDIWTKKITLTNTTPMGSIVTLAAAGSETSDSAVLTNEQTGQKRGLSTPFNRPCFAIMNPQLTRLSSGYNIIQSLIAVGSGGLFGEGFLNGSQSQLNFIPQQVNDFIFSNICEEWGFIGSALVVLAYAVIFIRGTMAAYFAKDRLGALIVSGVIAMFLCHVIINIGMVVGIMPITGLTLPFISSGGSSIWTFAISIGLIFNVEARRYVH